MPDQSNPPRAAKCLLKPFAADRHFSEIVGDLDEEFGMRMEAFSRVAAQRWYWFETLRNIVAFTHRELRDRPVMTATVAAGGVALTVAADRIGTDFLWSCYFRFMPHANWLNSPFPFAATKTLIWFCAGALTSSRLPSREVAIVIHFATLYLVFGTVCEALLYQQFSFVTLALTWAWATLAFTAGVGTMLYGKPMQTANGDK